MVKTLLRVSDQRAGLVIRQMTVAVGRGDGYLHRRRSLTTDDTLMDFETIRDDFAFLDDWEDRYRYVIELGRGLEAFPEEFRTDDHKVRGCVSQVWLVARRDNPSTGTSPHLSYVGDSDAMIVKGLIAILLALYNGKTAEEILAIDTHALLDELGLNDHLTPQRSNGLKSMVERIRSDAAGAC